MSKLSFSTHVNEQNCRIIYEVDILPEDLKEAKYQWENYLELVSQVQQSHLKELNYRVNNAESEAFRLEGKVKKLREYLEAEKLRYENLRVCLKEFLTISSYRNTISIPNLQSFSINQAEKP